MDEVFARSDNVYVGSFELPMLGHEFRLTYQLLNCLNPQATTKEQYINDEVNI